jgi:hypothetical protein
MASSVGHTGVYGALGDYNDNNAWFFVLGLQCLYCLFCFKMVATRNSQRTSPLYTRDIDTMT